MSSEVQTARVRGSRLAHWLAQGWHLPWGDKLLLPVAWLLLTLSALALRVLPARIDCRVLGRSIGAVACQPLLPEAQVLTARRVREAIRRAALVAPLRKDCLPQAITAAVLCRALAIPTATHLGAKPDDAKGLLAHAWVAAGPVAVSGGHSWSDYTVVACFARP